MDLFFILRVTTAAGIFVGLALGGIDIFLNRVSKKKHSFRFYVIVRSLFYVITFIIILSIIITRASVIYVDRVLDITLSREGIRFVHSIIFTFVLYSIITGILISFIAEKINTDNNYNNEEIGSITLKGKEIPISIYSIGQQV